MNLWGKSFEFELHKNTLMLALLHQKELLVYLSSGIVHLQAGKAHKIISRTSTSFIQENHVPRSGIKMTKNCLCTPFRLKKSGLFQCNHKKMCELPTCCLCEIPTPGNECHLWHQHFPSSSGQVHQLLENQRYKLSKQTDEQKVT